MWISEKASRSRTQNGAEAGVGPVTIPGTESAVLLSGENRGLRVLAPGGFYWRPEANAQVMVLRTADGERFILGTAPNAGIPLEDGELILHCGETSLKICRDGVHITGALYLNGIEITAGEGE